MLSITSNSAIAGDRHAQAEVKKCGLRDMSAEERVMATLQTVQKIGPVLDVFTVNQSEWGVSEVTAAIPSSNEISLRGEPQPVATRPAPSNSAGRKLL
jgi:hypothetical protein